MEENRMKESVDQLGKLDFFKDSHTKVVSLSIEGENIPSPQEFQISTLNKKEEISRRVEELKTRMNEIYQDNSEIVVQLSFRVSGSDAQLFRHALTGICLSLSAAPKLDYLTSGFTNALFMHDVLTNGFKKTIESIQISSFSLFMKTLKL